MITQEENIKLKKYKANIIKNQTKKQIKKTNKKGGHIDHLILM